MFIFYLIWCLWEVTLYVIMLTQYFHFYAKIPMMMIAIVCHKYVETPQKSWEHILLRQYHIQSTASMNIIA